MKIKARVIKKRDMWYGQVETEKQKLFGGKKKYWKTVTTSCFTKEYAKMKLYDYVMRIEKDTVEKFDIDV